MRVSNGSGSAVSAATISGAGADLQSFRAGGYAAGPCHGTFGDV